MTFVAFFSRNGREYEILTIPETETERLRDAKKDFIRIKGWNAQLLS